MDYYEIVTKLVGNINPVGETQVDDERFKNLQAMTELVDKLLSDIDRVAMLSSKPEYSISRAGKFAADFFDSLGISNN